MSHCEALSNPHQSLQHSLSRELKDLVVCPVDLLRSKLLSHCTSIACKQSKSECAMLSHGLTDADREVQEVVSAEGEPQLLVQQHEDLIDAEAVALLNVGSGLIAEGKRSVHAKH